MKHLFPPPGLILTGMLFGLAIFFSGCSSSYTVSSTGKPDAEFSCREMNEELGGRETIIELKDGGEISAKGVMVSNDSVAWLDASTTKQTSVATQRIKRIVLKNRLVGGLEGLGIGLVAGAALMVAHFAFGSHTGEIGENWVEIGLILGGGAGAIVGLIYGLIAGHSYNYDFQMIDQSDSLQNGK